MRANPQEIRRAHREGEERRDHCVRDHARLAEDAPCRGDERDEERRVSVELVGRDEGPEAVPEHVARGDDDEACRVPEVREIARRPPHHGGVDDKGSDRSGVDRARSRSFRYQALARA